MKGVFKQIPPKEFSAASSGVNVAVKAGRGHGPTQVKIRESQVQGKIKSRRDRPETKSTIVRVK